MKSIRTFLQKHFFLLTLLLIVLIGGFLRFYDLDGLPPGLNQDEAVNGYDAYALGINQRDHHGNYLPFMLQSYDDWVSPILTYITIPFVKVLGLSEFSIRLPVAILGTLTIILFYIFVLQVFKSKKVALLGAMIIAFSPWAITLSRWAIPPSIVPFFLLLFMNTLLWGVKKKFNIFSSILVGVTALLLTHTYPTQKLFVPMFLFLFCLIYFKKEVFKKAFVMAVVYTVGVLPIFLPTIVNPERYNARFGGVSIFNSEQNFIVGFVERYVEYFSPYFLFLKGDFNIMQKVLDIGLFHGFLSIFFFLGLIITMVYVYQYFVFFVAKRKLKKLPELQSKTIQNLFNSIPKSYLLIILLWVFLFPIASSLTVDRFHTLRVIHGLPVIIIFILIGLKLAYSSFNENLIRKVFIGLVVFLSLFSLGYYTWIYFGDYKVEASEPFQYGIKEFMEYLEENEEKFDEVTIDLKINNPYIYYLFYSEYDPNKLDYSKTNEFSFREDTFYRVEEIGEKYNFLFIDEDLSTDWESIYEVKKYDRVWYTVYKNKEKPREWIVARGY